MKTLILVYSYTGNNELLARHLATEAGADLFRLEETRPRSIKTIVLDMMLGRKPRLKLLPAVEEYDLVIFMSPIWMFHIPSPLRSCLKALKKKIGAYGFISLSGGALGANPDEKIRQELKKRMGREPVLFRDFMAADYCSGHAGSEQKETYLLKDHPADLAHVTSIALSALNQVRVA